MSLRDERKHCFQCLQDSHFDEISSHDKHRSEKKLSGGIQVRRLVLIAAITVAILSPAQRSAAAESRFISLEGRFSISLQDRSDSKRFTIPTPFGNAYGNVYEWQNKEATFGIGYADTLNFIDKPERVKQLFDQTVERFRQLATTHGGNISATKNIMLDKHPGIELRIDLSTGSLIERMYVVSRRIYETTVLVKKSQYEKTAVGVLDSFKLLSDPEITEEALKAGPGPLPQTPEAPRAGSDAEDEGLRGPVKSVRSEIRYLSETPFTQSGTQSWITTYNEKRNKVRTDSYDFKNNLYLITIYGYLDGSRVSTSKLILREYSPPVAIGGGGYRPSNKPTDPRYKHRFEFKYDDQKRLIEKTDFSSNGDLVERAVYKYEGNQKEELVYLADGSLSHRSLDVLDDKGNVLESTDFAPDGSVGSKLSYTYEFDSNGNWTKRTRSWIAGSERLRQLNGPSVQVRTITYW